MKNLRRNTPLGIGLLIVFAVQILNHIFEVEMPDNLFRITMLIGLALWVWGLFIAFRSPEMKNSKLRRWKLRLIGKGTRDS